MRFYTAWVYVGNTDSVVRFPYRNGDLQARGAAEEIVPRLPVGGHRTRDVVFSPDGKIMLSRSAPAPMSATAWAN